MKLLLDTNAFLWFVMGSANLSGNARVMIEDPSNEKLLVWPVSGKWPTKLASENSPCLSRSMI
jgi:PIN domain nuclease of toxin-antitoxin system